MQTPAGLLAAGGDLSWQRLLLAYQNGIFPWFEDDQPILWWSPPMRAVVRPEDFKPSKSLAKLLRRNPYQITLDQHFEQVITRCRTVRTSKGQATWITPSMVAAYTELFDRGLAHAIACFKDGVLVGGLYGLSIGNVFCGESMFSEESGASKVAFSYLARVCTLLKFSLIDCQMPNPHLMSLGAAEMPRKDFLKAVRVPCPHPPKLRAHQGILPEWQILAQRAEP